jgi:hypothetical protein
MEFKRRTLSQIANMICGNAPEKPGAVSYFKYRSSSYLTQFFEDCDTDYRHDGTTRSAWVEACLQQIMSEAQSDPTFPPNTFCKVIQVLMDQEDATNDELHRPHALEALNATLVREGFEAFYAEDRRCYLRNTSTKAVAIPGPNPHRPFTAAEVKRREQLIAYLDGASEDELIEDVLLPLFRQLGFHRVTPSGHKDKALEYGRDIWMKYTLPTLHVLYFGIQVKKGKLDTAGATRGTNENVAEIHNQILMMLGHELFDPEIGKRVLVDHAFIVAGGEITKAAKNWIGNKLDASKRSQIMFMDRDDILNLFIVTNLPLPAGALPKAEPAPESDDDGIPF